MALFTKIINLKFLPFYLVIIPQYSCYNLHNNFTYYKEKPFNSSSRQLKLNGIYYCKNISNKYIQDYYFNENFIYLYKDGSVYLGSGIKDSLFWNNPDEYLVFFKHRWSDLRKSPYNKWGSYIIKEDSLFFQVFVYTDQFWMRRNTVDFSAKIINDSTINIISEICDWCEVPYPTPWKNKTKITFDPPIEYKFYHTTFKPDSSDAWYKSTSWYKEWILENKN